MVAAVRGHDSGGEGPHGHLRYLRTAFDVKKWGRGGEGRGGGGGGIGEGSEVGGAKQKHGEWDCRQDDGPPPSAGLFFLLAFLSLRLAFYPDTSLAPFPHPLPFPLCGLYQ